MSGKVDRLWFSVFRKLIESFNLLDNIKKVNSHQSKFTDQQLLKKVKNMEHDIRPWGEYFVLEDAATHKVKRIKVKPKGRLSYQYHHKRSEVWTIVSGTGRITLDGETQDYKPGEVIQIPQGMKHRIENPSETKDCVFIEVQLGTYFGEDDIVRIEDDYDRK